jgi:hypothetical protein
MLKKNSLHFSCGCCCCEHLKNWLLNRSQIQLEIGSKISPKLAGNWPKISPKRLQNWTQNDPKLVSKLAKKLVPKLAVSHPKMCRNTYICVKSWKHGRMARGGHELPKVSPGPAIPYPSTHCSRVILETPYGCFMGGPPLRAGNLLSTFTTLDTPRHMPMV